MAEKLTARIKKQINVPVEKVWAALTTPEQIKEYMFGTHTESTWEKGDSITYTGEWEGKQYKDGGTIADIIPNKLLHTTYFSSMSGLEDKPENYSNVIYELEDHNGITVLTVTQDNIDGEERKQHSEQNWDVILDSLKNLLED